MWGCTLGPLEASAQTATSPRKEERQWLISVIMYTVCVLCSGVLLLLHDSMGFVRDGISHLCVWWLTSSLQSWDDLSGHWSTIHTTAFYKQLWLSVCCVQVCCCRCLTASSPYATAFHVCVSRGGLAVCKVETTSHHRCLLTCSSDALNQRPRSLLQRCLVITVVIMLPPGQ